MRRSASAAAWLLFVSLTVVVPPSPGASAAPDTLIYLSSNSGGTAGGVRFYDEDILSYDTTTGTWAMYFDGSDVGLATSGQEVDAFYLDSDGSILLSLGAADTIPNVGAVDDHDIVRFTPTSTGENTAGTYSMYLNGEDYELTGSGEDIDAIGFTPDGRLVISPRGSYSVPAASGGDSDLLVLESGAWQKYFDGPAAGLADSSEDINAIWFDSNGDLYLATRGAFSVNGLSGDGNDIFVCAPVNSGPISDCGFSLYWDGDSNGFAGEVVNGMFLGDGGGTPVERPPVANGDTAVTPVNTPVTVNVAANDTDPDGNLDPASASTLAGPTSGSTTDNADGTITYTPNVGFTGPDSFTYEICDITALCDTATVDIDVTEPNDPPVANDDSASTDEDTLVVVNVTSNDNDPDGNLDPNSAVTTTAPTHGSTTDNGNGTITYTPNLHYNGPDSFVYRVCDTLGSCDTATVSMTVIPVSDPPVAVDDSAGTNVDTPVTINVASNDSDPDGNLSAASAVTSTGPSYGSTVDNGDGTITYTPSPGHTGGDSFVYTICDTTAPTPLCDTAQVTITISSPSSGFTFAAFGDFGRGNAGDAAVAALVEAHGAEYVVTAGDNRYIADIDLAIGKNYHSYIGNYQGTYGPGAPVNRFFPTLGNHDYSETGGVDVYLNYFTLPGPGVATSGTSGNERYYDVIIEDLVQFFIINSEPEEPDGRSSTSTQAQWLQAQLAASTTPWQVVLFHRPAYSSSVSTSVMQWPFEAWGADVVISGHLHYYERLQKGATTYFVVGTGGAGLTGSATNPDPDSQYFQNTELGPLIVDVCAERMSFEFYGVNSGLMDSYSIGSGSCGAPASPTVSVTASDPDAGEPANDGEFTFTRTGSTSGDLTVAYSVGGSATGGSDYSALSGSVVIPGGSASATVLVDVMDDGDLEGTETVIATVLDRAAYDVGAPSSATVNIADNDLPVVTVNATDPTAAEPADDGTFTVYRTGAVTNPMTVNYTVSGSATPGSDYVALTGSVTIPAGQPSAPVLVDVLDDGVAESSESVVLTLAAGAGYNVGSPASGTVTINDDGDLPQVTVAATDPNAGEPSNGGQFTFTRSGPTSAALTVHYTLGGGATNGSDYSIPASPVTIPAGSSSQSINVSVIDDGDVEGAETVILTIEPNLSYTVGVPNSGTVTIADDDGSQSLDVRVSTGNDDAEERPSGSVSLGSSDLELIQDKNNAQTVGMRFQGIAIPRGASIISAWVQFQVDETSSVQTDLTIRAQAADNAATFANSTGNITGRAVTGSFVLWGSVPAWNTVGQAGPNQRTPELKTIIQEVVNRPGWSSGNALALIVTGTGSRVAESYNGTTSAAPLLHVEYSTGTVPNSAPIAADDTASAVEGTPAPIDVVGNDFDVDGNLDATSTNTACGTCSTPSFGTLVNGGDGTFTYTPAADAGGNTDGFVYEVCDLEALCDTASVTITILDFGASTIVESRVASSTDDAEERTSGNVSLTSSDLEMVMDKSNQQIVGMRFLNIDVPQGATITNAWIQFQVDEASSVQTDLLIKAQLSANASTFVNSSGDISSRPTTTSTVSWASIPAWNTVGAAGPNQQTPDISALIQEVVAQGGWSAGNSIAIIISGTGSRVAESYNGFSAGAPLLHVEYTVP